MWLSDFTFTFHFHALEKEMATHSSVLALRIPGMGEPGGLPSVGSHRVGHDWSNLAAAAAAVEALIQPFSFFFLVLAAPWPCMVLVPQPGIEHTPPALGAQSLNHWTTREVLSWTFWKASLVAQVVKNLRAMRETQVQSLGWKDSLEKGMATHSSILAWSTP